MPVCQYFLRGACRFGDRCRYEHPDPGRQGKNVCQYFLRGTCSYGDRCKFEHPGTGSSGFHRDSSSSGFSHRSQSSFGGQNFSSTSPDSSRRWQSGRNFGQNRFGVLSGGENFGSTFGRQQHQSKPTSAQETEHTPSAIQQKIRSDLDAWEATHLWPLSCYSFSKGRCISGLIDYSPEELRFTAYKCIAQGNTAAYHQGLGELASTHRQRMNQLKAMSPTQIAQEINKERQGVAEDSGFVSVFGDSHPQATTQGAFKMFPSTDSNPAQTRGVGGTSFSQSSVNVQQPGGIFGSSSNSSGFGVAKPPGLSGFGSSSGQPGNVFGNQAKPSDDSTMMAEPSGFGMAPAIGSSGAGVPVDFKTSGRTGQRTEAKTMEGMAFASAFRLTEEDLAAFKAPTFTLGKIPECPPPPELC